MSALTPTRAEIRRLIGQALGDCLPLTATSAGTTTRFTDSINLGIGNEQTKARDIVFTSGLNLGAVRRVESSGIGFVEFEALDNQVLDGATAELYNFRGRGWKVSEYDDAIKQAQYKAWPLFALPVVVNSASAFDRTTGTIDVPSGIDFLEMVEYEDADGFWHEVPKATRRYGNGFSVSGDDQTINVRGRLLLYQMDGRDVRLSGYLREAPMDTDDETTKLSPEWLIYTACEILCFAAQDRNPDNYNRSLVFREKAEAAASGIRTKRRGWTVRVAP